MTNQIFKPFPAFKIKPLEAQAISYCFMAHAGQKRKYTNDPYAVHPVAVASMVKDVLPFEEVIAAAYLHDVIEDTNLSYDHISSNMGSNIADLVLEVSDVSKPEDGNRAARKAIDRNHLSKASANAKTIKLADIIDNARSICLYDKGFAKVFVPECLTLLPHLIDGHPQLYAIAHQILTNYKFLLAGDCSGLQPIIIKEKD